MSVVERKLLGVRIRKPGKEPEGGGEWGGRTAGGHTRERTGAEARCFRSASVEKGGRETYGFEIVCLRVFVFSGEISALRRQGGYCVAHRGRSRKATHRLPRGGKGSWSPPAHQMGKETSGEDRTAMNGVRVG